MPAIQMPLRQHPSASALRHADPLRQHASPEAAASNGHVGASNGHVGASHDAVERALPPVGAQSLQDQRFATARKPSHPYAHSSPRERFTSSPAPPGPRIRAGQHIDSTRVDGQSPNEFANHHGSRSPSPQSRKSSIATHAASVNSVELPALQAQPALEEYEPLSGDLPGSFDLVAQAQEGRHDQFSLEKRSEQIFSREHLDIIFSDPSSLIKFTAFLSTHRPQSVPMLIYYLDSLKALKAIKYANAVAEALSPIASHDFTSTSAAPTHNEELEEKARKAFSALVDQDLPAYVTHMYIQIVSLSISQRITGTLPPHLREASEGLAEVFCLTDPSRPDNPIVFASEEFHRTTQYGMNYAIGRNCRFLQGPRTDPLSTKRIGNAIRQGKEHCEVFLNYRRDGSPFMNMLMLAPLCDSRGKIRYFIGAQVDVSGLAKECTDMETLQELVAREQSSDSSGTNGSDQHAQQDLKDGFQELSEMLNMAELETVRKCGGRMHREYQDDENDSRQAPHMPRLLLQDPNTTIENPVFEQGTRSSGRLSGIYQNYLLVRPYPSFRILFASPSLRVPGILQSPFMDKIGGSSRVRNELSAALAEGRGVTAKVRWVSKHDEDGRSRWIHCTPLLGSNGQIGVWMIVLIDNDNSTGGRRWKQAPPVAPARGHGYESSRDDDERNSSSPDFIGDRIFNTEGGSNDTSLRAQYAARRGGVGGSLRSSPPTSLLI